MRTRREIESKSFESRLDDMCAIGSANNSNKEMLEVLLDIRELLLREIDTNQ